MFLMENLLYQLSVDSDCEKTSSGLFRKQLIYVGQFVKGDQKFSVTEDDIDHWVLTHNAMSEHGVEVPVPVEHTVDPEARRGTVARLEKGVDAKGRTSLFGYIQFALPEYERLAASSNVSIYVPPSFKSGVGKTFYRPIQHVALTDYPVIPDLSKWEGVIACSLNSSETVKMNEFLKKLADMLGLTVEEDATDEALFNLISSAIDEMKVTLSKYSEPPAKKEEEEEKPIAAGFLSMARDFRTTKIDSLVSAGKITKAVGDKLKAQYCQDSALSLSLTKTGQSVDGFDGVVAALSMNASFVKPEATPAQKLPDDQNPMLKVAKARAGV